jgi:hypothetical protein
MFLPAKDYLSTIRRLAGTIRMIHCTLSTIHPTTSLRYDEAGRMRSWLLLIPLLLVVYATLRLRTETDLGQTHGVLTSVTVLRAFPHFFLAAHTTPLVAPIFHYLDSWLNPIEPHFASLRRFAINNSNPNSHEKIAKNIRRFIALRNSG